MSQLSNVQFVGKILSYTSQLDYLRLTREKLNYTAQFTEHLPHLIAAQVDMGNVVAPYQISDMKGKRCGAVAYAESKTHLLVEFRGGIAERVYPLYTHLTSKATRLDMAITVWLQSYERDVARQVYDIATRYMVEQGWNKIRKMPVMVESADGDTCYLGSRSSEVYLRVYDKFKQSKDDRYENAWRFEAEYKGSTAQVIWQNIQMDGDVARRGVKEVKGRLAKFGVGLPQIDGEPEATKVPYDKTPQDVISRLRWLQTQVRPALEDLSKRGFREAALAVLGIAQEQKTEE